MSGAAYAPPALASMSNRRTATHFKSAILILIGVML